MPSPEKKSFLDFANNPPFGYFPLGFSGFQNFVKICQKFTIKRQLFGIFSSKNLHKNIWANLLTLKGRKVTKMYKKF